MRVRTQSTIIRLLLTAALAGLLTPISRTQVTLEMPRDLETTRTFSSAVLTLQPLPGGGLLAAGPGVFVLTNNLQTNPNFNLALFGMPADVYPGGGFVCAGDLSHFVWRLDATGARVESFVSPPITTNDVVRVIVAQPDGKVLAGGEPRGIGTPSIFANGLIRLNADGSVDTEFQHDASTTYAQRLILLADGKILCLARPGLSRLLTNGQSDATFQAQYAAINSMALQPDGKIIICGWFSTIEGVRRPGLARLQSDGVIDLNFSPPYGGPANLSIQSDGRIVFGTGGGVIRFLRDGQVDPSFSRPQVGNAIDAIAVDASDRIYVTASGGLVEQFSGRVRIRAPQSSPPLVLERSSLIDSGWAAVLAAQIGNSLDFVPDFPGTGNSFFRARPAQ